MVAETVRRMNEQRRENRQGIDQGSLWLLVCTLLALVVAADPPFGLLRGVASVGAGALVGLLVSRYYSKRASEEPREEADKLRRETEDMRHYINALISYLEAAGEIRVVRNGNGRPIKTEIIRVIGIASEEAVGSPLVLQDNPPESGQGHEDAP